MTFKDFLPYPMKEALTNALRLTDNVMLKLPKNQDLDALVEEIK
jgi:BarA-like signal transduction histidine kinase